MCLYHDRYYQQRPVDHGLRQVLLLQLVSAELGSGPTDMGVGFKAAPAAKRCHGESEISLHAELHPQPLLAAACELWLPL